MNVKARKKKNCCKSTKVVIYKTVYIIHFVIIIGSCLALIRLALAFGISKENTYTIILLYLSTADLTH